MTMSIFKTRKLAAITIVYWFLLSYILVALVFWFFELQHQNERMTDLLLNELRHDEPNYYNKTVGILDEKKRKTAQYIGEGSMFLALILVGAVFVYRAIRRQIMLSQQQQNFMMAVTHELKTPIAITQLNLETLQKRRLDETQQQKLITNTLQEANRLNTLCNNILLASQLDGGEYKISKNEINLSEVVKTAVEEFKTRFPNRNICSDLQNDIYVFGEQLLLQMLMNNLIDNALKYTPKDKEIKVSLKKQDKTVSIIVADKGAGIADDEKKKVFEKFYRVGNEGTRTAKGSGLGLYLCKRIAKDHNGTIRVEDNEQVGSIFTVEFKS
jgi:two-component system sensor histidine kinase CiaH